MGQIINEPSVGMGLTRFICNQVVVREGWFNETFKGIPGEDVPAGDVSLLMVDGDW